MSDVLEVQLLCPFYRIPYELRLPIYSDLISSGNLAILRVSKFINVEAVDVVSKHGIYRIKEEDTHRRRNGQQPRLTPLLPLSRIQKVEINLRLNESYTWRMDNDAQPISDLYDTTIIRESCEIRLTIDVGLNGRRLMIGYRFQIFEWALWLLARLKGFKHISLEILVRETTPKAQSLSRRPREIADIMAARDFVPPEGLFDEQLLLELILAAIHSEYVLKAREMLEYYWGPATACNFATPLHDSLTFSPPIRPTLNGSKRARAPKRLV